MGDQAAVDEGSPGGVVVLVEGVEPLLRCGPRFEGDDAYAVLAGEVGERGGQDAGAGALLGPAEGDRRGGLVDQAVPAGDLGYPGQGGGAPSGTHVGVVQVVTDDLEQRWICWPTTLGRRAAPRCG